jgi:glucose-1-phosphate adenylyltransferase
MTKILALVLAGGNDTRLRPLTDRDAKPALPFAGGYRIIDFVLGSLINSGVSSIHVLVQYKPRSLIEHIDTAWADWSQGESRRIGVVRPRSDGAEAAFKGTADAVYRNLDLVAREAPDLVAVFAADHVYRMDVRQMADFHVRSHAEVSVATVALPLRRASEFGIVAIGADGRIEDFQEKPPRPAGMPGSPDRAYASMGNYLFEPQALVTLLEDAHRRGETDFGRHVLPRAIVGHRVVAYDFASNTVPGTRPYEERAYWRDIGTLDAYRSAQLDVLGSMPRFSLVNPEWSIRGGPRARLPGSARGALPARVERLVPNRTVERLALNGMAD